MTGGIHIVPSAVVSLATTGVKAYVPVPPFKTRLMGVSIRMVNVSVGASPSLTFQVRKYKQGASATPVHSAITMNTFAANRVDHYLYDGVAGATGYVTIAGADVADLQPGDMLDFNVTAVSNITTLDAQIIFTLMEG